MKEKTFISTVVYVFNSENIIASFLQELDSYLFDNFEIYEIILVNDCSTDNTKREIEKTSHLINGTLTIINLAWRHKKELAMLAGTDLAIGDFVFEIESTHNNFNIDLLGKLYEKSISGYDIVSAFPNKGTKKKSKLFYWFLNRISYLNIEEQTETAKIVSRKALNRILLERNQVRYRKILYKHSGFPTASLYYSPVKKLPKQEDLTFMQKLSLASDVIIVFSNIGLHIAILFSSIFALISIFIGIYALIAHYIDKAVISGWTTTMLFLSVGFTGIFVTLSIIAKYISTILLEQRHSNLYTPESLERLNK